MAKSKTPFWPSPDLHSKVYISRPHAVERFVERAGLQDPDGKPMSHVQAEAILREAVVDAVLTDKLICIDDALHKKGGGGLARGVDNFAFRLAHKAAKHPVWPLVQPGDPSRGVYKWMVHTVFAHDHYQDWNQEGRLGTLAETLPDNVHKLRESLPQESASPAAAPAVEPAVEQKLELAETTYYIFACKEDRVEYQHIEVRVRSTDSVQAALQAEVFKLLAQGFPLQNIGVYRRIPLKLNLTL